MSTSSRPRRAFFAQLIRSRPLLSAIVLIPLGSFAIGFLASGVGAIALVAVGPRTLGDELEPRFSATAQKLREVERGRPWRLETDPSIGIDAVTAAFQGALASEWEHDGPEAESVGDSPLVADPTGPFPAPYQLDLDEVLPAAARGLDDAERAYLGAFAEDPRLELFSQVARAEVWDDLLLGELQSGVELSPNAFHWETPIPKLSDVRYYAYGSVAVAGLRLEAGDLRGAAETLRETVSIGFLMMDESSSLIGALVGSVVAGVGIQHLEVLRDVTDPGALSDLPALTDPEIHALDAPSIDARIGRTTIFDRAAPRQLRFEAVGWALMRASCATPRGILLGPPDQLTRAIAGPLREELVRTEREARLYEAMLEWEARLTGSGEILDLGSSHPDPGVLEVGRRLANTFGQRRIAACWALMGGF